MRSVKKKISKIFGGESRRAADPAVESPYSREELGAIPKTLEANVPEELRTRPSLTVSDLEDKQRQMSSPPSSAVDRQRHHHHFGHHHPSSRGPVPVRMPQFVQSSSQERSATTSSDWETEDGDVASGPSRRREDRHRYKQTTSSLADTSSRGLESLTEEQEQSSRSYQYPEPLREHANPFASPPPPVHRQPIGLGLTFGSPREDHQHRAAGQRARDHGLIRLHDDAATERGFPRPRPAGFDSDDGFTANPFDDENQLWPAPAGTRRLDPRSPYSNYSDDEPATPTNHRRRQLSRPLTRRGELTASSEGGRYPRTYSSELSRGYEARHPGYYDPLGAARPQGTLPYHHTQHPSVFSREDVRNQTPPPYSAAPPGPSAFGSTVRLIEPVETPTQAAYHGSSTQCDLTELESWGFQSQSSVPSTSTAAAPPVATRGQLRPPEAATGPSADGTAHAHRDSGESTTAAPTPAPAPVHSTSSPPGPLTTSLRRYRRRHQIETSSQANTPVDTQAESSEEGFRPC